MNDELIEKLKKLASTKCFYDDEDEDVTIDDYAGGNVDDAFYTGECAGEVTLARTVLTALAIEWTV